MKSKLALFSLIVPCFCLVVASALAQTHPSQSSRGEGSSVRPAHDDSSADSRPMPNTAIQTAPDNIIGAGQASSYSAATFYRSNDWRVHNEEAAITPIVQQLKDAKSDGEVERIKARLDEALDKAFATRQTRYAHEIEELETKVKKLKELVAKRQDNRREIIANRRDQILRDAQGLGW
jgi:hypothetical protein